MNTVQKIILFFSIFVSLSGHTIERTLVPQLKADASSGLRFSVPYAAGVHKGTASRVDGILVMDETDQVSSAHFEVAIGTLSTGNATRDCHMREALGLDYTHSRFPNDHVCDSDNQTPSGGPDAIVHPLISLDFVGFEKAPATPIAEGLLTESTVTAQLKIHGQSKELVALPIKILKTKDASGLPVFKVTCRMLISLKEFNVIVKPFTFGPIKIGVDDKVTVDLDLTLAEKKQ